MRVNNSQSGATLVEASYTLVIFFTALFSLMHCALAVYRFVGLQHSLSVAGRFAALGNTLPNLNRINSIKQKLLEHSQAYGMSLAGNAIRICPASDPNCLIESPGGPGQLITISASEPIKLFNRPVFTLQSSVTVLNEDF